MTEIINLAKVQLLGLFQLNQAIHEKNPKQKLKLIGLFFVFVAAFGAISVYAYIYSRFLGRSFAALGKPELLLGLMMGVASVMIFFTTIYKAHGTLFAFKDYDLLMSLPVSTAKITATRMLLLYLTNLIFCLLMMVPAAVVYAGLVHPGITFYLLFSLSMLLLPLLPLIVATFVGCLIAMVSSRFRQSKLVNMILMTIALFGFMILYSKMMTMPTQELADIGLFLSQMVNQIYPLSAMFVSAVTQSSLLAFAGFVTISLVAFVLYCWVIGKNFKRINTALTTSAVSSHYRKEKLSAHAPFTALYRKEFRRYFSSSLYVFNTAFGLIGLLLISFALFFFPPEQLMQMLSIPQISGAMADYAPLAVSVLVGMTCTTCCAISLEGSQFWILTSSPVSAKDVFFSKIAVNLSLTLPTIVLCAPCIAMALHANGLQTVLLFIVPAVYSLFIAVYGLYCNLLFPNLTWTTETTPIKQSASALIGVMTGLLLGAAPFALSFALPKVSITLLTLGSMGVAAVLTLVFILLLLTDGVKRFYRL